MTEAEWLAATDPTPMLETIPRLTSVRKRRLFLCECVRRVSQDGEQLRSILMMAERSADGSATNFERASLVSSLMDPTEGIWAAIFDLVMGPEGSSERPASAGWPSWAGWPGEGAIEAARSLAFRSISVHELFMRRAEWQALVELEQVKQANFLRDIFGNPFRSVAVDPAWLTPTVVAVATGVYEERAFDRLPILADALEDAGCNDSDVLTHCRSDGLHVRGCWVVDLLLGKC